MDGALTRMVDMHDYGGRETCKFVMVDGALILIWLGAFGASALWWSKNYYFLILAKWL